MTNYLLDTNVALRLADLSSPQNRLVTDAVATLLEQQQVCYLSPQVLTELWVVATRPTDVNGLGWSAARTTEEISRLMDEFPLLEESQQVFSVWLNLVTTLSVLGKRAHDARIAATMLTYGVTHLLTFNTKDFIQVPDINAVDPQAVVSVS